MVEPYACLGQLIACPGDIELVSSRIDAVEPRCAEEEALVAGWATRRRAEFLSGRACARGVMAALGIPPTPIPFDADGVPCWPPGMVGSISHKRGFCVASGARSIQFASIGVDLECGALEPALTDEICLPEEAADLVTLRGWCDHPLTLVFSAKEAFFKCQYPVTRRFLRWRDVAVTFRGSQFTVSVHGGAESGLRGRFGADGGWVATLALFPRL
jgi:enterobactin synthetase component D / holo-[acyl-carrier protein] synthase